MYHVTHFIGQQIRKARQDAGLSQRAVAQQAQVTQAQVSRVEQGGDVQMRTLLRIAQTVGLQMQLVPFDIAALTKQWMRDRGKGLSLEEFEAKPMFALEDMQDDD